MTAPDPKTKLSGKPRTFNGVTFAPYRTGILRSVWMTEDGRARVGTRGDFYETYIATVDDQPITNAAGDRKRFRTESAAFEAAAAKYKATTP